MQSKRCTKCGEMLPISAFRPTQDRRPKGAGIRSWCVGCENESRTRRRKPRSNRIVDKIKQREYMRRCNAKRRATARGKLNHRISSNIAQSLRGNKAGRRWETLVGYSVDELRLHLQRQFCTGMSWQNIGQWHIDHILPLAGFVFVNTDDVEFRAAWALSNLRPLWAAENMKKRAYRLLLI